MNIEWWQVGLVLAALLIVREVMAFVFGWGLEDENGVSWKDCKDPEGGTIGKMINWHKREVQHTTIGWRPDPIYKNDGFTEGEPLEDGTPVYHRKIR